MVERRTIGRDMTAVTRFTYTVDDVAEFEAVGKELETHNVRGMSERMEKYCLAILRKAGFDDAPGLWSKVFERNDEDSPPGYAVRLLHWIRWLRTDIAEGDAELAAWHAWRIGDLICEWDTKKRWEPHAMLGLKIGRPGKNNFAIANIERKIQAVNNWKPITEIAKALREDHKDWNFTKLARSVKERLTKQGSEFVPEVDTIRKRIAKELARPA